jgi:hypothetical protein
MLFVVLPLRYVINDLLSLSLLLAHPDRTYPTFISRFRIDHIHVISPDLCIILSLFFCCLPLLSFFKKSGALSSLASPSNLSNHAALADVSTAV